MTSIKKLVAIGAAVLSMAAMTISGFAATGEDAARLKAAVPAKYQDAAAPYIEKLPNSEVDNAIKAIEAARADSEVSTILKNASSVDDLTKDEILTLISKTNTIAENNGVTLTVDPTNGTVTFGSGDKAVKVEAAVSVQKKLAEASGTNVDDPIKDTGVNAYVSVAILSALGLALVGCGVVASKKRA